MITLSFNGIGFSYEKTLFLLPVDEDAGAGVKKRGRERFSSNLRLF
jgi:hypothetical protein